MPLFTKLSQMPNKIIIFDEIKNRNDFDNAFLLGFIFHNWVLKITVALRVVPSVELSEAQSVECLVFHVIL